MSNLNFDATTVEPQQDFSALPAGEYMVVITGSDVKPTKSGSGMYLQLTMQVVDGNYKNRLIWHRINIQNTNQEVQRIGQQQLAGLCRALGLAKVSDSSELHLRPFVARLSVSIDKQYGESNDVKAYRSVTNAGHSSFNQPAQASAPPFAQPPVKAHVESKSSKAPWVK